jgi:hypothetical protein
VLGEASFVRTDGSKGTIDDAVFTTAPKDADSKVTDSTTTSSFNQTLVAASLVAVAGAAETQEQTQTAPATTESTPVVTESAPASTAPSEPTSTDDSKTSIAPADDQSTDQTKQPVQQASHGEEQAPDHASLSDHGTAPAPASADTAQTEQPSLGDHQALLAQSINLPSFNGNAAAAVLAAAQQAGPAANAAEVVKEALGAHDVPNIDALLAALPGGAHPAAPALLNPAHVEMADAGHMAAATAIFEAAMAAHEAMAVAHA